MSVFANLHSRTAPVSAVGPDIDAAAAEAAIAALLQALGADPEPEIAAQTVRRAAQGLAVAQRAELRVDDLRAPGGSPRSPDPRPPLSAVTLALSGDQGTVTTLASAAHPTSTDQHRCGADRRP
jgi:hypothetical protein